MKVSEALLSPNSPGGRTLLPQVPEIDTATCPEIVPSQEKLPASVKVARDVILNFAPVGSPWHLPVGIATLAAAAKEDGHNVTQRYSHILGVEHVLGKEGKEALGITRNSKSNAEDLYKARMTLERISRELVHGEKKFLVGRNNVTYVAQGQDGSIESLLYAMKHPEANIFHGYFKEVELPLAERLRPNVYGISINEERQLIPGIVLASMIRTALPQTLVVLGGNFWSRAFEAYKSPEFSKAFDFFNAIVYSEGYQPFDALLRNLDPKLAPGTAWNNEGKVVINERAQVPTSFETLPTPIFDGGASQWSQESVYPLYTQSNCPCSCSFCAIAAGSDTFLQKPRIMSPKRIAEHMVALGGHRFDFVDELISVQRQIQIGQALEKLNYHATWQTYLTVTNDLLNPRVCEQLYKSGCRAVQMGLESLSPSTLDQEQKRWNHPQNYGRILQNLTNAGIQVHAFIIVGIPGEPLHRNLGWVHFLEKYGNYILTIKAGRYRLARKAPDEARIKEESEFTKLINLDQDISPLHLNINFHYSDPKKYSQKRIMAMRDMLEIACYKHWAYQVTSTIPWWINRGRYTIPQLREMAKQLPEEVIPPKTLKKVLIVASTLVKEEMGMNVSFKTWEDLANFSRKYFPL